MGAGAKCDPTRIQISDVSDTIYDPLARSVRRHLRSKGVSSGIPVVYSTEVPSDIKLLPLPEEEFQKGNVNELGVFDDFRVRILPVLGAYDQVIPLAMLSPCNYLRNNSVDIWSLHRHVYRMRAGRQTHSESFTDQEQKEIIRTTSSRPSPSRITTGGRANQVSDPGAVFLSMICDNLIANCPSTRTMLR
jgi:hypothetical protein